MGICILERWWEERLRDDYESLEESQDWLPISRDWNYLFCYVRLVLGFPSNSGMGLIDSVPGMTEKIVPAGALLRLKSLQLPDVVSRK